MGLSYQKLKNIKKNSIILEKRENIETIQNSSGLSQTKKSFIRERFLCQPHNTIKSNSEQKNSTNKDFSKEATAQKQSWRQQQPKESCNLSKNFQHEIEKLQQQEYFLNELRTDKKRHKNNTEQHKNKSKEPEATWAEHLAGNCCKEIAKERFSLKYQCVSTSPCYSDDPELLARPRKRSVASQMSARREIWQQGAKGDYKTYLQIKSKSYDKDKTSGDIIETCIKAHPSNNTTRQQAINCHNYQQMPAFANREYTCHSLRTNSMCKAATAKRHCRHQNTELDARDASRHPEESLCSPKNRSADAQSQRKCKDIMNKINNPSEFNGFIENIKRECEKQMKTTRRQLKKLEFNKMKEAIGRRLFEKEMFSKFLSASEAAELVRFFDCYIDERENELSPENKRNFIDLSSATTEKLNSKKQQQQPSDVFKCFPVNSDEYSLKTLHMLKRMKIRDYKPQKTTNKKLQENEPKLDKTNDNKQADKLKNYQQYLQKFSKEEEEEMEKSRIKETVESTSNRESKNIDEAEKARSSEKLCKKTSTEETIQELHPKGNGETANFQTQTDDNSQMRKFPFNKDFPKTPKSSGSLAGERINPEQEDLSNHGYHQKKVKDFNNETTAESTSKSFQKSGNINTTKPNDIIDYYTTSTETKIRVETAAYQKYDSDKIRDSYSSSGYADKFYKPEELESESREHKAETITLRGSIKQAQNSAKDKNDQHEPDDLKSLKELEQGKNLMFEISRDRIFRAVHEHGSYVMETHRPKEFNESQKPNGSKRNATAKFPDTETLRVQSCNMASNTHDQMRHNELKQAQYKISKSLNEIKSSKAHAKEQFSIESQREKIFSKEKNYQYFVNAADGNQSINELSPSHDHGVSYISSFEKSRPESKAYKYRHSLREKEFHEHKNDNDFKKLKPDHQICKEFDLNTDRLRQGTLSELQDCNHRPISEFKQRPFEITVSIKEPGQFEIAENIKESQRKRICAEHQDNESPKEPKDDRRRELNQKQYPGFDLLRGKSLSDPRNRNDYQRPSIYNESHRNNNPRNSRSRPQQFDQIKYLDIENIGETEFLKSLGHYENPRETVVENANGRLRQSLIADKSKALDYCGAERNISSLCDMKGLSKVKDQKSKEMLCHKYGETKQEEHKAEAKESFSRCKDMSAGRPEQAIEGHRYEKYATELINSTEEWKRSDGIEKGDAELFRVRKKEALKAFQSYSRLKSTTIESPKYTVLRETRNRNDHRSSPREFEAEKEEHVLQYINIKNNTPEFIQSAEKGEKEEHMLQYIDTENNTPEFIQQSAEKGIDRDKSYNRKKLLIVQSPKETKSSIYISDLKLLDEPETPQKHTTQKCSAEHNSKRTQFNEDEDRSGYKSTPTAGQAKIDTVLDLDSGFEVHRNAQNQEQLHGKMFAKIFLQELSQSVLFQKLNKETFDCPDSHRRQNLIFLESLKPPDDGTETISRPSDQNPIDNIIKQEDQQTYNSKQASESSLKEEASGEHNETLAVSYTSNYNDFKNVMAGNLRTFTHCSSQTDNNFSNDLKEQISKGTNTKNIGNEEEFLPLAHKVQNVLNNNLKPWLKTTEQTDEEEEDKSFNLAAKAAQDLINKMSSYKSLLSKHNLVNEENLPEYIKPKEKQPIGTLDTLTEHKDQYKDLETSPDSSDSHLKPATKSRENFLNLRQNDENEHQGITRKDSLSLKQNEILEIPTLNSAQNFEMEGLNGELSTKNYFEEEWYHLGAQQDAKRWQTVKETFKKYQDEKENNDTKDSLALNQKYAPGIPMLHLPENLVDMECLNEKLPANAYLAHESHELQTREYAKQSQAAKGTCETYQGWKGNNDTKDSLLLNEKNAPEIKTINLTEGLEMEGSNEELRANINLEQESYELETREDVKQSQAARLACERYQDNKENNDIKDSLLLYQKDAPTINLTEGSGMEGSNQELANTYFEQKSYKLGTQDDVKQPQAARMAYERYQDNTRDSLLLKQKDAPEIPTLNLTEDVEIESSNQELANTPFEQQSYELGTREDAEQLPAAKRTYHRYQESQTNSSTWSVKTSGHNAEERCKPESYTDLIATAGPQLSFDPDLMPIKGILKPIYLLEKTAANSCDLATYKTNLVVSGSGKCSIGKQQECPKISNLGQKVEAQPKCKENQEINMTIDSSQRPITRQYSFKTKEDNAINQHPSICQDCQLETEAELENCYNSTSYTVQMPAFKQCPCMWDTYVEMMINYYKGKKLRNEL